MINRPDIITDKIYASANEILLQKVTSEGSLSNLTLYKVADEPENLVAWFLPYESLDMKKILKEFLIHGQDEKTICNTHFRVENDTRINGSCLFYLDKLFINVRNNTLKNGETIKEKNQYTLAELLHPEKQYNPRIATIENPNDQVMLAFQEMAYAEELLKYFETQPKPSEAEDVGVGELGKIAAETEGAKKRKASENNKPTKKGKVVKTDAEKEEEKKRREELKKKRREEKDRSFLNSLTTLAPQQPAMTVQQPRTTVAQPLSALEITSLTRNLLNDERERELKLKEELKRNRSIQKANKIIAKWNEGNTHRPNPVAPTKAPDVLQRLAQEGQSFINGLTAENTEFMENLIVQGLNNDGVETTAQKRRLDATQEEDEKNQKKKEGKFNNSFNMYKTGRITTDSQGTETTTDHEQKRRKPE